ncbi:MAG TPA: hypothetical protein VFG44_09730 [Burkholderiales bacterium]|jgi:hypothetical protein|nr:hypothetical protein [Burkholderiales bacterium]
MSRFEKFAVLMDGRAGLGDAERLGRAGARGRPRGAGVTESSA